MVRELHIRELHKKVCVASIIGFTEYVKQTGYKRFVYDSNNQRGEYTNIAHSSSFDKMIYMLCPNRLCILNDSGSITFNSVKHIEVTEYGEDDSENSKTVFARFTITCADYHGGHDNKYVILAD